MGEIESDVKPSKMVYEPILEQGVFRFDCSADARTKTFPSLSFLNPKQRDTLLMSNHNVPSYIPTFEYVAKQQIVHFKVSCIFLKITCILLHFAIMLEICYLYVLCKASKYGN